MLSTPTPSPALQKPPLRAIAYLTLASFASQAMVRSVDTLLPQIATDFDTTVGTASIVVTAYAITHGTVQLVDRKSTRLNSSHSQQSRMPSSA